VASVDVNKTGGNTILIWVIATLTAINTVVCTATGLYLISIHNSEVTSRKTLASNIDSLIAESKTTTGLDAQLTDLTHKSDRLDETSKEIAKRQEINEINIELDHDLVKSFVLRLPTTHPIVVPEEVPLPPRKF
jgi:hypothetical protein